MKCWEQGGIDEKVILGLFFNLRHDKGVGDREAWNQTLTHLRLPGLNLVTTVATYDSCTFS